MAFKRGTLGALGRETLENNCCSASSVHHMSDRASFGLGLILSTIYHSPLMYGIEYSLEQAQRLQSAYCTGHRWKQIDVQLLRAYERWWVFQKSCAFFWKWSKTAIRPRSRGNLAPGNAFSATSSSYCNIGSAWLSGEPGKSTNLKRWWPHRANFWISLSCYLSPEPRVSSRWNPNPLQLLLVNHFLAVCP